VVLEGLRLLDEGGTPTTTFPPPATQADGDLLEIEECEERVYVGLPEWVYEEIEKIRLEKRHSAFDEYVHAPAFVDESDPTESARVEPADDSPEASERRAAPEMFAENIAEQISTLPVEGTATHDPDRLLVSLREMVDKTEKPAPTPRPSSVPSFLEGETARGSYSTWKLATVLTAIIVLLVAIAVPWGWYARSKAAKVTTEAPQAPQPPPQAPPAENPQPASGTEGTAPASDTPDPSKKAEAPLPQAQSANNESN
jgi:hypothetical protein